MNATDLLRLAGALTETEVNRLAHALGWPDLHLSPLSPKDLTKVKWDHPIRNRYSLGASHPVEQWVALEATNLVKRISTGAEPVTFVVTPLGQLVARLRLEAHVLARTTEAAQ